MSYKRSNKIGNRWAKITNFQNDNILTESQFNQAFENRTVNTWEWAEMTEKGWTKPRQETTFKQYVDTLSAIA